MPGVSVHRNGTESHHHAMELDFAVHCPGLLDVSRCIDSQCVTGEFVGLLKPESDALSVPSPGVRLHHTIAMLSEASGLDGNPPGPATCG